MNYEDQLRIQLLGELVLFRGGQPLALPPSRKARALLAYLILRGKSHRRERLCSLLWDEADDPRGALRWTLSRIRSLVDSDSHRHILADRESVGFDATGVSVDVFELGSVSQRLESATIEELERCAQMARDELLEGLDFHDFDDYQGWCGAEREAIHQKRVAILRALNTRLRDDPNRALVVAQELVRAEPVDEQARLAPEVPDVFVTMNPHIRPRPEHVIAMRFFEHPVACQKSQEHARNIDSIQGQNNTWFAGSYLIEPFVHEQAIQSGMNAAGRLLDSLAPATLVRPWSVPAWASGSADEDADFQTSALTVS